MAFCASCGKEMKDGVRFCPFCGAERRPAEPLPAEPLPAAGKEETGKEKADVEYVAFISYRHRPLDRKTAVRIQKSVENYTVPKGLRRSPGEKKLGRVFRDEDELPISSNLSDSITYALDRARFLIVVCTPELPLSRWCEEEIRYFIRTHDRDHVIAVLADGTPETSFSPLMLHTFEEEANPLASVEPLAANVAAGNGKIDDRKYRKEIYRIYAALIGCRFDELWQRAKRANARRTSALFGAAAALMAAFSIFLISKNTTIRRQSELISAKNDELTARMSTVQTDLGNANLAEHDLRKAKENGIRAIEDAGSLYDRRAEKLLSDALTVYEWDFLRGEVVFEQEEVIVDLEAVGGSDLAVILDRTGDVACVNAVTGKELWRRQIPEEEIDTGFNYRTLGKLETYAELLPVVTDGVALYKDYLGLTALSLKDGSEVWTYRYACHEGWLRKEVNLDNNAFRALSGDGKLIAVLDRENEEDPGAELVILDAATGVEKGRIKLDFEIADADVWYLQAGFFTEDGSALAVALCAAEGYRYLAVDLETMRVIDSYQAEDLAHSVCYGVHYDRESGDLFTAQLQPRRGGVVTTVFHRDGKKDYELTHHTISTDLGKYMDSSEYSNFIQPMLVRGNKAIVASDEIFLLYDIETGELMNSCDISGRIIDSGWAEGEEMTLYLLSDKGMLHFFRINSKGGFPTAGCIFSDAPDLDVGSLYLNGFENDGQPVKFVSVSAESDGRLLAARYVSDPTARFLELPCPASDVYPFSTRFALSPSGKRLFVHLSFSSSARDIEGFDYPHLVIAYDARSMLPVSSLVVEGARGEETPGVLDDEHFIYGGMIYGMDGSRRELAAPDGADLSTCIFSHARLTDGALLTWCSDERIMTGARLYTWVNGEETENPWKDGEPELEIEAAFYAGGNGLIVLNGRDVADGSKKGYFAVCDVRSGSVEYIRDDSPGEESLEVAVGTEKPVFAAVYGGKRVVLCDMAEKSLRALEEEFPENEIKNVCFSKGDAYLLLLTRNGVLRCYNAATGELVWSGAVIEDHTKAETVKTAEGLVLPDGRLFYTAQYSDRSNTVIVDVEHDVILQNVFTYYGRWAIFPETGKVFRAGHNEICAFDLHTKDDLLRMARESLG